MENLCVKIAVLLLSTYAKFADAMSSVGSVGIVFSYFKQNAYSVRPITKISIND